MQCKGNMLEANAVLLVLCQVERISRRSSIAKKDVQIPVV